MLSDEIRRQKPHDRDQAYERRRLLESFGNHSLRQHRDDRAGCERQNGRGLSGRRAEQKVSRTGGDADK